MSLPPGYSRVDVAAHRRAEMHAIDQWAFAMSHNDEIHTQIDPSVPWTRARAIEAMDGPDAGALVAVHSSFAHTMRVPGGTVATSGLTWVGVHPSHRRRGLLRAMIADHFERSLGRGEPVSTLFAAETAIYQRFGYGLGCAGYQVTLGRGGGLRQVAGSDDLRIRLEDASFEAHAGAVRAVLARDPRPGVMTELGDEMLSGIFVDPELWRAGKERKRIAIVEDEHGPAAFAIFQREAIWENSLPRGKGYTKSWASATAAAERRLWSVVADLDLIATFSVPSVPLDSPLITLAEEPRGIGALLRDLLWVRILDVPAALEARTYLVDGDFVIDVRDDLIVENAGPWRMRIEGGEARVERAAQGAQVDARLDIQQLSAAYLGGVSLAALGFAGLVEEVAEGSVATLSDAFGSRLAPRAPFVF